MATAAFATQYAATDEVRLDAATHTYYRHGRPVPGVTRALSRAGILDFTGIPQYVLDRAAERGRAVHLALEYLDAGTLDPASVSEEVAPYVRAYERFCADTGFIPGASERSRYNGTYGYAGTFDRTGLIGNQVILLDFKTGEFQQGYFSQLAAYLRFFRDPRRFRAVALRLFDNARYRLHEMPILELDYYWNLFRAALVCEQWRIAEG